MKEKRSLVAAEQYRTVSAEIADHLVDGDLDAARDAIDRRVPLVAHLESAAEDADDPDALLDILREVAEMDRIIEEGLRDLRDRMEGRLETIRGYSDRYDLSFEARAYDQRG